MCRDPGDVFFNDAESVHIERMDDGLIRLSVRRNEGMIWVCNFHATRKGRIAWNVEGAYDT